MKDPARWMRWFVKPLAHLACLSPALWLVAGIAGLAGIGLGANPAEEIQDTLGITGLRLLLVTLAISPLRELLGWPRLLLLRRLLGLWAFAYIAAHFLFYLLVDQGLAWPVLAEDIAKRPYITAGFTALLLLLPLAATSTRAAMRRLGRRWQSLHRLVYPAAILGCVHYYWQVKADLREPVIYLLVLAVLLGFRVRDWLRRSQRRAAAGSALAAGRADAERDAGQHHEAAQRGARLQGLAEQPPG